MCSNSCLSNMPVSTGFILSIQLVTLVYRGKINDLTLWFQPSRPLKEKFAMSLPSKPTPYRSMSRQKSDSNSCCNRRLVFVGGLITLVVIGVLLGVIIYLVGKNLLPVERTAHWYRVLRNFVGFQKSTKNAHFQCVLLLTF